MGWKKWPLAAKLGLAVTLVVVAAVAGLTAWSIYRERQNLHVQMESQARLILDGLSSIACDALSSQETARLSDMTDRLEEIPTVLLARFFDGEGRGLGDSTGRVDDFARRALEADGIVFEWQPGRLLAGQALIAGQQRLGAMVVGLSTAALEDQVAALRNRGLGVGLAAALAGTLLALLVSQSVTGPLRDVQEAVQGIAKGEWPQELPARGGGELADLTCAVNDLAAGLRQGTSCEKAIVQAISEGVLCIDYKGCIVEANPAAQAMFGLSSSEMAGHKMSEFVVQSSTADNSCRDLDHYIAGDQDSVLPGRQIEAFAIRPDGSRFPIRWAMACLPSAEQALYAVIVRDMSEQEQAEKELRAAKEAAEAASRAKSAFLASMSHELRTPLSSIVGYSELLQESAYELGYQELLPDLEKIRTASSQLRSIIDEVLDFSKIEAGRLELSLETFELASLLDEVEITSRPLAARQGNKLQVEWPADIGTMHADRVKVRQILLNLLSNAAKFTRQGEITLAASRETVQEANWILFRVADTGIGISPEQLPYLFETFTQTDASIYRQYGGSGLGLTISRSYCEAMGGEIQVESTVGEGTTFTIRLPAVISPTPSAGEPSPA